jgi:5'-nucleotidase
MHILVTNDDGVQAPGLLALAHELRALGKVTVFAPDRNWSYTGRVITLDRPLRVREVSLADDTPAWACDGAPSDCVALPLMGFIEEKIDVVVSGINPNANIGDDVTYSGTVTAAMEAVITGKIPGIAVSLNGPEYHAGPLDFSSAAKAAARVTEKAMANHVPEGVLLNVNVPYLPMEQIKGYAVTRQGKRIYLHNVERRVDPRGRPYYWIGGDAPTGVNEEGTDFGALMAGYVSITPLHLDFTARAALKIMNLWNWD